MDPRDPLPHPYRAADAQCDKLTVDRRKYREINLADNGSVCRTKLAVRCDDRCIVSKLSTVQSLKQGSKVPLFWRNSNSLQRSVGQIEESPAAKNQLDPLIRFDRTPTYDRQTDAIA